MGMSQEAPEPREDEELGNQETGHLTTTGGRRSMVSLNELPIPPSPAKPALSHISVKTGAREALAQGPLSLPTFPGGADHPGTSQMRTAGAERRKLCPRLHLCR